MDMWNDAVEVVRAAMFLYAQATGGSLGMGIVVVSLAIRMIMLPLTLRVARLTAAHQAVLRKLQPELEAIRARYRSDPERVMQETRRLFAREGADDPRDRADGHHRRGWGECDRTEQGRALGPARGCHLRGAVSDGSGCGALLGSVRSRESGPGDDRASHQVARSSTFSPHRAYYIG